MIRDSNLNDDWVREVSDVTCAAANHLRSMVLLVVINESGASGVAVAGVPQEGELAELAKDVPSLLLMLSMGCRQERYEPKGPL